MRMTNDMKIRYYLSVTLFFIHFCSVAQVKFEFMDDSFFKFYGSPNVPIFSSWKEALKEGEQVRKINIKNEILIEKLDKIDKIPNTQIIKISDNQLTYIPREIGKLNQLFVFISMNNPIEKIAKEISGCKSLMYLILDGTALDTLPESLASLRSLELLAINKNTADTLNLNYVNRFKSLRNLEIGESNVFEIPENISNLERLEKLVCLDCKLSKLPQNIGLLTQLKHLDLSYNQIYELPNSIFMLNQLEYLNLRGNKLTDLSEKFYYLKNLKYLDIRGNMISEEQYQIIKIILPKCYIMR
jgi:leucine-rich repeat protein SHOC2